MERLAYPGQSHGEKTTGGWRNHGGHQIPRDMVLGICYKSCNNLLSVWSENARKMKKLQVDINIISQVTGLSPEEIKAL